MKSYFAKLAARATLVNTPVTSNVAAPKLADPFANTAALETTPESTEKSTVHRQEDLTFSDLRRTPTSFQIKTSHPNLPAERLLESPLRESPAAPQPPRPESQDKEIRLQPPATEIEARPSNVERDEVNQFVDPLRLSPPQQDRSPIQVAPRATDELRKSSDEAEGTSERIAEMQQEQSVLLRKADLFMERLFQRRTAVAKEVETDQEDERDASERDQLRIEAPPGLRAMPPTPRDQEPVGERPSLHIGQLTVEVLSPAPAPAPQLPQVVFVRGQGSNRVAAPSSRRFGLSQF